MHPVSHQKNEEAVSCLSGFQLEHGPTHHKLNRLELIRFYDAHVDLSKTAYDQGKYFQCSPIWDSFRSNTAMSCIKYCLWSLKCKSGVCVLFTHCTALWCEPQAAHPVLVPVSSGQSAALNLLLAASPTWSVPGTPSPLPGSGRPTSAGSRAVSTRQPHLPSYQHPVFRRAAAIPDSRVPLIFAVLGKQQNVW